MLKLMRSKAQSTAEYAIVIGLVIAAALAMQIYVKRQLQGKIRDATNYTDTDAVGYGIKDTTKAATDTIQTQYEPYYNTSDITSGDKRKETVETITGGGVKRVSANEHDLESTRKGEQGVEAAPN